MKKNSEQQFVAIEAQIIGNKIEFISGEVRPKCDPIFNLPNFYDGVVINKNNKEAGRFFISLAIPNKGERYISETGYEENKLLNIYRLLDGESKILIRRIIKSLDSSFYGGPFFIGSPAKITHYTQEESDLLCSFRALNLCDKIDLLNAMHIEILSYDTKSSDKKLTNAELLLIEDFRQLNLYEQELIKNNIKAMLPVEIESKQKKKSE